MPDESAPKNSITFASLKKRILASSWLRPVALRLAPLARDLPRWLAFQHVPVLQRWSGRPVGWHATAREYLALHPARGWDRVIRPGGNYERVRPIPLGTALPPHFDPPQMVAWPEERVTFLEGCRFWGGYGGSIIAHDERLIGELSPDVWGVKRHTLFNMVKLPASQALPGLSAILSTPEADTNYSHWMMELLPRIELLAQGGFGPERVDRYLINLGGHAYERETLALAGIPPEKIVPVDAASHFRCEQVIAASLRPAHWQYHAPAWLSEYLCRLARLAGASPSRRLYLSRATAAFRRVVNEDELLPILAEHGFAVFDPASRAVGEQAEIFANAEMIVSPHSSALTNLVFCRADTSVLELFPADYHDVSFWTAATLARCRYRAIIGERLGPAPLTTIEGRRQDISIPPERLR